MLPARSADPVLAGARPGAAAAPSDSSSRGAVPAASATPPPAAAAKSGSPPIQPRPAGTTAPAAVVVDPVDPEPQATNRIAATGTSNSSGRCLMPGSTA